jgi:hypothetical protein
MKRFTFFTLFAPAGVLLLVSCGGSSLFGYGGADTNLLTLSANPGEITVSSPDAPVLVGDAGDSGDGGLTLDPASDTPSDKDPPPSVQPPGDGAQGDDDNDGIPNGEDDLPGVCTNLRVISAGVSSARVILNEETVFGPGSFHNEENVILDKHVNLLDGSNNLSVRLAGSPGDYLIVQVWNCSKDPAEKLFEMKVTRTTGAPAESGGTF